jgi:hypothetical protein
MAANIDGLSQSTGKALFTACRLRRVDPLDGGAANPHFVPKCKSTTRLQKRNYFYVCSENSMAGRPSWIWTFAMIAAFPF